MTKTQTPTNAFKDANLVADANAVPNANPIPDANTNAVADSNRFADANRFPATIPTAGKPCLRHQLRSASSCRRVLILTKSVPPHQQMQASYVSNTIRAVLLLQVSPASNC